MYRDRINEQKKMLGMSNKTISERSKLHLPEETISRFLSNKNTHDAYISTFLDVCDAVGMQPYEAFMDAITSAEFKVFLETKLSDIDNAAELEMLRAKTAAQESEIAILKEKIQHKDEIIAIHNYYCSLLKKD
jgi:hypothetical protein